MCMCLVAYLSKKKQKLYAVRWKFTKRKNPFHSRKTDGLGLFGNYMCMWICWCVYKGMWKHCGTQCAELVQLRLKIMCWWPKYRWKLQNCIEFVRITKQNSISNLNPSGKWIIWECSEHRNCFYTQYSFVQNQNKT